MVDLVFKRYLTVPEEGLLEIGYWRTRVLNTLLFWALLFGTIAYVPSLLLSLKAELYSIAALDTVAILWLAVVTLHARATYLVRTVSLLVLSFVLGVALLITVGPVSLVYLMAFPILAGLLLGLWPALLALVINGFTLFAVGLWFNADFNLIHYADENLTKWLVVSANFMFINTVITFSAVILLQSLETSLRQQRAIANSLEDGKARLQQAHDALAREMEDRRRAQQEVSRLAMAVEQAQEIMFLVDTSGEIYYANPAYATVTGRAPADQAPPQLQAFRDADPAGAPAPLRAAIAAGQPWTGNVLFDCANSGTREMEAVVTPLRGEDNEIISHVIVLHDVTNEREMELRLRRSQKLESIGTLAGGIAHDFNNILGAIMGITELVRAQTTDHPTTNHMDDILDACQRARDIVAQILPFSRQGEPERRPIVLRSVIEQAIPLIRASIPATVEIRTDLQESGTVNADPTELHRVIMNLCTNAWQAMEERGGMLKIQLHPFTADAEFAQLHPPLRANADYWCIAISDTGHGIDRDTLSRIFHPFFTTNDRGRGTGLGLAAVHGIVASLQGYVSVYSEPGLGTTFRIYLPQSDAPAPTPAPQAPAPLPRGCGHILLVDDEEMLLDMSRRVLEGLGYTTTTAQSGEHALGLLSEDPEHYDLLLTDLTMPGMTGAELIESARVHRPDIPVILTSGYADALDAESRAALGVNAFLPKPYTRQQLAESVRTALHNTLRALPC